MTLWQCKIVTRNGVRSEVIAGDEDLTKYIDRDLLERGEVGIVIQYQLPETPPPRPAKPWWKFW